ncbi:MAG: tandem-95 repeat protein [Chloroflexota bacterium]|nr:MAG: tandem-95 repeat protein [Chloroflexota bacterium]
MKTKTFINLIIVLVLLVASFGVVPLVQPTTRAATNVRVKPGGSTSAGCGSTWGTACELQTALTAVVAGTEIWVAAGTYKPGINRTDTFQLKSGVALYGGFAGTETARNQRDWETNLSVLSGDIGVLGDISDNSLHVVVGDYVDATAILDGFTITGGNADEDDWIALRGPNGGGMYNGYGGNPSVANVIFTGNSAHYGGGMANIGSNPSLVHVTFSGNSAWDGGGMFNSSGNPVLTNVNFIGNTAGSGGGMSNLGNPTLTEVIFWGNSADYGGGIYNFGGNPSLTNVTFIGNGADSSSGIFNDAGNLSLTNVTFSGNKANYCGVMLIYGSNTTIVNTILWGNSAGDSSQICVGDYSTLSIRYSDVQGGCTAIPGSDCSSGGNIDDDPLFVRNPHPGPDGTWGTADDDYGDLRLQRGSPVIDAGDNTAPGLVGVTNDLVGNPRFYDVHEISDTGVGPAPVVDMGAYERQANHAPTAGDNSYSTNEDLSLHIGGPGVLANDNDPDGDAFSAVLQSGPSSGSLTLNPDGSFDYMPQQDYHGVVTFTYRATDGLLSSNTATVTITVSSVNDAPIALSDNYITAKNTNLHINVPGVLINDSDQDGDALSVVLQSGSSSGSLTLNPDGSFDYLPETNYIGVVTFSYQATDGSLNSNTATVTITVSSVNGAPVAVNDSYTTPENTKLTINGPGVLHNDSDPDGNPITAVLMSGPGKGSLILDPDGSFEYQPEEDHSGVVTFTYCASDSLLDSNIATVTITISEVVKEIYIPMVIR